MQFHVRYGLLIWIAAVVLLSLMPLKVKLLLGTTGPWHTWGHYLVFVATILVAAWRTRTALTQLVTGSFVILFGLALEGGEVLVYHNSFEWKDLLVDSLGVLTGLLLLRIPAAHSDAR